MYTIYIYPWIYSLTDSLISPHNALKNLAKVEKALLKPNSYKVSGSKSPGKHSLEAKTINLSTLITDMRTS